MADIFPFISVTVILLLIISIPINIRIKRDRFLKIQINFIFFAATFSYERKEKPNENDKRQKTRRRKKRLLPKLLPRLLPSALRALKYLLRHCHIKIHKIDYTLCGDDYARVITRYSGISLIANAALRFLFAETVAFEPGAATFSHSSEQNGDSISFDLEIDIISIFIPAAISVFFFDLIRKNIFVKGKGYVGKQNE